MNVTFKMVTADQYGSMVKDPFCFYRVYDNSSYTLEIGLYKDGVILKTWEELEALGLDITQDYSTDPNDENYYLAPNSGSAANVLDSNNLSGELVVPNNTSKIGDNAFADCQGLTGMTSPNNGHVPNGNVSIPSNTASVGSNAFGGTGTTQANIPSSTRLAVDAFANTPAAENNRIYMAGHPIQPIVIDLENADSASVTLEKGYVYQIVALYNFNDDVTGESTIESSDENIVLFIPDCLLRAVDKGHAVISGTYITQLGIKKHAEIDCNVVDNGSGVYVHIPGEIVYENVIEPSFITDGSCDEVIYCADCGRELSRTKKIIPITTAPGLYDKNGNMQYSWEELLAQGVVHNDNGTIKTNYTSGTDNVSKYTLIGSLILSNDAKAIGADGFSNCNQLTDVYIPDSVSNMGSHAFLWCTKMKSIRLSLNIKTIAESAFYGCSKLPSLVFPEGIETLGRNICTSDNSLSIVYLPASLKVVNTRAFYAIPVSMIYYAGTKTQWGQVTVYSGAFNQIPAKVVHCSDGDVSL